MSELTLSDFIPLYPSIHDEDFNAKINAKKEFKMHQGPFKKVDPIYFNHQMLTQIFLGPMTPNKKLYIFKDTGVGKTCDAIGLAETRHEWLNQTSLPKDLIMRLNTNKALIIAQNKTSRDDNFKKDIIGSCTAEAYVTEAHRTKKFQGSGRQKSETSSIKRSYELRTHGEFANTILGTPPRKDVSPGKPGLTESEIAKIYSFRPIFIDEAHMFKTIVRTEADSDGNIKEVGSKKNYNALRKFLDNIYGCLIVVMSATPIVNDILEFPAVMNFVTEPETRIEPEYFARLANIGDLEEMRKLMREYLTPRLRGKISRLKNTVSRSIVRTNEGEVGILGQGNRKLFITKVGKSKLGIDHTEIEEAYKKALVLDGSGPKNRDGSKQFFLHARYISNMVWPGGKVGKDARGKNPHFDYLQPNVNKNGYKFTDLFIEHFTQQVQILRRKVVNDRKEDLASETDEEAREDILADIEFWEERIKIGTFDPTIRKIPGVMSPERRAELEEMEKQRAESDLDIMLSTIESRYSPKFVSALEAIMGIEYDNGEGRPSYIVTPCHKDYKDHEICIERYGEGSCCSDNKECCYVYNFYKKGGVVPFGLFLEMFGYEYLAPREISYINNGRLTLSKRRRYALIFLESEISLTSAKIRSILEVVNHPDNKYGEYLKVVAGTDVSAQGINFFNMRQAHYISPKWNKAGIIQGEGRPDRASSFQAFDDTDPIPSFILETDDDGKVLKSTNFNVAKTPSSNGPTQKYVKIYRHVALFTRIPEISINLKMYQDAETKDLRNRIPIEIMEEIAYDLFLNHREGETLPRNPIGFDDEYPTDYTTYNLFHAEKDINEIKCRVRGLFKTNFSMTLNQISRNLIGHHISTVMKALTQMINENEQLIDRHGMLCYLREDNDLFFLQKMTRTINNRSDKWMIYYSRHNFVKNQRNFADMNNEFDYEIALSALNRIRRGDVTKLKLRGILNNMSNRSKSFFSEILVQSFDKISKNAMEILFDLLSPSLLYFSSNRVIIHIFNLRARQERQSSGRETVMSIPESSRKELRIFSLDEGIWRNTRPHEDTFFIPEINKFASVRSVQTVESFSHIGHTSIASNRKVFRIMDRKQIARSQRTITKEGKVSKRGKPGRNCGSIRKNKLYDYLWSVKIDLKVTAVITKDDNLLLIKDKNEFIQMNDIKAPLSVLKTVEIHYHHVYPEILHWLFNERIKEMSREELLDPNFYPIIKNSGKLHHYKVENFEEYKTIIDLLPRQGDSPGKKTVFDYIYSSTNTYTSMIERSMNMLFQNLKEGKNHDALGKEHIDPANPGEMIQVGERFERMWSNLPVYHLCFMIYVLFYLQGSVIES